MTSGYWHTGPKCEGISCRHPDHDATHGSPERPCEVCGGQQFAYSVCEHCQGDGYCPIEGESCSECVRQGREVHRG